MKLVKWFRDGNWPGQERVGGRALSAKLMPLDRAFFGDAIKLHLSSALLLLVSFARDLANHQTYPEPYFEPYDEVLSHLRPATGPVFQNGLAGEFDLAEDHQIPYGTSLEVLLPDESIWSRGTEY